MGLWLFYFSTSEDQRNCETADELIPCRETDLILQCRLCSPDTEMGAKSKVGKGARPPCGSHGCGVLQHTSTGLLELHEGCCPFQNSCMISEEGPVPRQGSPFVPGSSVESSFSKLFSKLFFQHLLLPCLAC